MTTLEVYPHIALYVAGRFRYLPAKAHVEDYAIAMNLSEQSLADYAADKGLYGKNNVIRSCDLQIAVSDDVESYVEALTDRNAEISTQIERLAHAYKFGLPCHLFLG